MHQQIVRSEDYPSLRINFEIRGMRGQASARLDTGFGGFVALPSFLWSTEELGLLDREVNHRLADGNIITSPVYFGTLEIEDVFFIPDVDFAIVNGPYHIVGRGVLNHFEVTLDHGLRVIIGP